MVPSLSIHTHCPVCRRPFLIVWSRDASSERTMLRCPHVIGGRPCQGRVEVTVPPDAHAIVGPRATG